MIQAQTYLKVADNTGAKKNYAHKCLESKTKFASLGDIIIGVVKL